MKNLGRRAFLQRLMITTGLAWQAVALRADEPVDPGGANVASEVDMAELPVADAADQGQAFNYEWLLEEAKRRSDSEYQLRALEFTGDYQDLTYDQYRDIRFKSGIDPLAQADSSFHMDLLPPGFLYNREVNIFVVDQGRAIPVPFSVDAFDFGPLAPRPDNPDELSYSGLRLRYPVNRADVLDEVAVFQGASYFRAVARGQLYGLSARGLTVDTAGKNGEEFPVFTDFWVERPVDAALDIRLWALLDSPSVTGAFQFDILPGAETIMEVRSTVFARTDVASVGIAPLTSMFLFNTNNRYDFDDYRDAVHDSEGLQMITGRGERLWRTLNNPGSLQVSTFVDTDPKAFGLVQRHRQFTDYEDAEARYELRPSAWVQPNGSWGKGAVELVEIPSPAEINDNIVAYWRPAEGLRAGESHQFNYRLSWTSIPGDTLALLRVDAVRIGQRPGASTREIVVDFAAVSADHVPVPVQDLSIDLSVTAGIRSDVRVQTLPGGKSYRVSFDFEPEDVEISDMRLVLVEGEKPVSEVWLYRWTA